MSNEFRTRIGRNLAIRLGRLTILAVMTILVAPFVSAQYRVEQVVHVGDMPPVVPAFAQHPRTAVTESGYCAAWLDRRQGGAILATRIDEDGTVHDPFGLPIAALGDSAPQGVVSAPGGCLVLHQAQSPYDLVGHFLPADPDEAPGWRFALPGYQGLFGLSHDRILGWFFESLQLYATDGTLLHSLDLSTLDGRPAAVLRVGEMDILVTRSGERWWFYEFDDTLSATPRGTYLTPQQAGTVRFAGAGDGVFILFDRTTSEGFHFDWRVIDLDGEEIDSGELELPLTGYLQNIFNRGGDITLSLKTSWQETVLVHDARSPNPSFEHVAAGDLSVAEGFGRAIAVSFGTGPDGESGLIFELDRPDGAGEYLSWKPLPQKIHDIASANSTAAILWSETTHSESLILGVFDGSAMSLDHEVLVTERVSDIYASDAAVEVRDEMIIVVWTERLDGGRQAIRFRRANPQGAWLEPARDLAVSSNVSFHSGSLVRSQNQFLLMFREGWSSGEIQVALIPSEGEPVVRSLGWDEVTVPSILPVEDGFILMSARTVDCSVSSCPTPPGVTMRLFLYDHDFHRVEELTPENGLGGALPFLERSRNGFSLFGYHRVRDYERLGAGVWRIVGERNGHGARTAAWSGDRFVIAAHRAVHPGFVDERPSGVIVGEPATLLGGHRSLEPLIPDWITERGPEPDLHLHQLGERLVLFANVVSTDPEEGFVRRIRAYELERVPRRKLLRSR